MRENECPVCAEKLSSLEIGPQKGNFSYLIYHALYAIRPLMAERYIKSKEYTAQLKSFCGNLVAERMAAGSTSPPISLRTMGPKELQIVLNILLIRCGIKFDIYRRVISPAFSENPNFNFTGMILSENRTFSYFCNLTPELSILHSNQLWMNAPTSYIFIPTCCKEIEGGDVWFTKVLSFEDLATPYPTRQITL